MAGITNAFVRMRTLLPGDPRPGDGNVRFRGFFVKKGTPTQRLTYLQNLFAAAYKTPSFQKFNESKYMTIIDPFRDPKSAKQLINQTITSYSKSYQDFLAQTLNEYFKRK